MNGTNGANRNIDFSFVSALCVYSIKTESKLKEGGSAYPHSGKGIYLYVYIYIYIYTYIYI